MGIFTRNSDNNKVSFPSGNGGFFYDEMSEVNKSLLLKSMHHSPQKKSEHRQMVNQNMQVDSSHE